MATIYRPTNLTPPSKLAQRLFDRHKLQIPVEIEILIKEYADIEEVIFPTNVDAVLLERKDPFTRPKVLISKSLPKNRLRFTLAHELGHILIPWHVGTIFCHTDASYIYENDTYWQIEKEANDFASELLINSNWIFSILSNNDLVKAFKILRGATVSDQAIIIKLQNSLPFNSAIALCETSGSILSIAENLSIYKRFDKSSTSSLRNTLVNFTETNLESSGGRNVCFFQDMEFYSESSKKEFADLTSKVEDEKSLFIEILKYQNKSELSTSINGIIGHANNRYPFTTDFEFYLILIKTFFQRESLKDVVSDARFKKFCALKAKSLRN
ncbi:ImmA/IrrE family metallo-endopeptidase [Leptospira kanakyensis]|uniref:ImmA/IrrE family metallo-endopeptidase n=1 Tax=Leptospira kanakyensis TaxID=2484968 RepID=UPI00223DB6BD|nr:ImmA/IrrE family metallo-endopeptidase [Leptospira kanakyensis]MCW7469596.1 ImmA/IrrE family metallo-endopeptidase [Leptospira kanakyensis]